MSPHFWQPPVPPVGHHHRLSDPNGVQRGLRMHEAQERQARLLLFFVGVFELEEDIAESLRKVEKERDGSVSNTRPEPCGPGSRSIATPNLCASAKVALRTQSCCAPKKVSTKCLDRAELSVSAHASSACSSSFTLRFRRSMASEWSSSEMSSCGPRIRKSLQGMRASAACSRR